MKDIMNIRLAQLDRALSTATLVLKLQERTGRSRVRNKDGEDLGDIKEIEKSGELSA